MNREEELEMWGEYMLIDADGKANAVGTLGECLETASSRRLYVCSIWHNGKRIAGTNVARPDPLPQPSSWRILLMRLTRRRETTMRAWWKNPDALSSSELYEKLDACWARAKEHEANDRPALAHAAHSKVVIAREALNRKGIKA